MDVRGKQPAQKATPARTVSSRPTLQKSVTMASVYERKGAKWKELTDAVTNVISKDSRPIYMVEKSGFKWLLRTFVARYQLPFACTSPEHAIQMILQVRHLYNWYVVIL